ncbi:hypothetical protein SF12_20700 [Streptomyces sp. MBRL 601]|nr:hypothetical protein SF12_20700 [Streptomyces sp. MBRL 601]
MPDDGVEEVALGVVGCGRRLGAAGGVGGAGQQFGGPRWRGRWGKDQRTQPLRAGVSRSRARCQRWPPSVETSTRRTGAAPDQERPVSTVTRPAGRGASTSSSKALLRVCRVSGALPSSGWPGPKRR